MSTPRGGTPPSRATPGPGPLVLIRSLLVLGPAIALGGAEPPKPWLEMDYGPFLTASIEAPTPEKNIAFKGIAIPMGRPSAGPTAGASNTTEGPGAASKPAGHPLGTAVFDTDLLRYSAAWTGGFVALKGVVYDGEHWAYPQIEGSQILGNRQLPGWADANGAFNDPRPFIYGPLPASHAKWRGLYRHGNSVVLSYTVGGTPILELPDMTRAGGLDIATRTIEIGPHAKPLVVQVAYEADTRAHSIQWASGNPTTSSAGKPAPAPTPVAIAAAQEPAGKSVVALMPTPPTGTHTIDPATERRLAEGLLGHWTFDTPAGESPFSGATNTVSWTSEGVRNGPGIRGGGASFEGDARATAKLDAPPEFLDADLSWACWIQTREDGSILSIGPKAGDWAPDGKAWFVRAGKLVFDVGWVGSVESASGVSGGAWTHVALTWSHSDAIATLYVNGKHEAEGTLRPKARTPAMTLKLGYTARNFPAAPQFHGNLDDLRWYDRRLSDQEVRALAAGATSPLPPLVATVTGGDSREAWVCDEPGNLRLRLPASTVTNRIEIAFARAGTNHWNAFTDWASHRSNPRELAALTRGGPSLWSGEITAPVTFGDTNRPYAIDRLGWPDRNPWNSWMRFGDFDFFGDGDRAAISTWSGDVWIISGLRAPDGKLHWRRFAAGLYQPLGLRIVKDRVFVLGRDQITLLRDLDGDGEADSYENFNNDTQNTEHFHEFALGLQTDADGNFYYMKAARHARDALHPQHGTLMRVKADGSSSEILAKGFRAPNGLAILPDGRWYSTDQEGYWMPANRLNLIRKDGFYGNVWSWFPEGKPTNQLPPVCWVHPKVDRSPSAMVQVDSSSWGPWRGQVLSLSYGTGRVFALLQEEVDGVWQGGITPLPVEFDTGLMRGRFNPADGQFYVCGLYGWAGNKTQPGGFYRIRYTGAALHQPSELHAASDGVVIRFTDPLDPTSATDPGNYSVETWGYQWTQNYGSPDFKRNGEKGRDTMPISGVSLSQDQRSVFLKLDGMAPTMQMHVQIKVRAADGALVDTFIHNTIHKVPNVAAEKWIGPAPLQTAASAQGSSPDIARAPGLIQSLRPQSPSGAAPKRAASHIARLAALRVREGEPASPFLEPGRFDSEWRGFIKLDINGEYRFSFEGSGTAQLEIEGAPVLASQPVQGRTALSAPVRMRAGSNRVRILYASPDKGPATFRLLWTTEGVPPEPVPPTALAHDPADPDSRAAGDLRLGRELALANRCVRCHATAPAGPQPIAEAISTAPNLANAGDRLNPAWLPAWLSNPRETVPDSIMPACLKGDTTTKARQATDIAAYLATLRKENLPSSPERAIPTDPESIAKGEKAFTQIGCAACHKLPGDKPLPEGTQDTRRSLAHVRAKWRPAALADFLLAPEQLAPWIRMPNFKLDRSEATAIATFLLSRAEPPPALPTGAGLPSGNIEEGARLAGSLGCAGCHEFKAGGKASDTAAKSPSKPAAPAWQALDASSSPSGCLAASEAARGSAPDFGFTPGQVGALRTLLATWKDSLLREEPMDFARRQLDNLRCASCHPTERGSDLWFAVENLTASPTAKKTAASYGEEDENAERTIHRQRPPLTWAGEKLRGPWLESLFRGTLSYKPRPKLEARMPSFPTHAGQLADGWAAQYGIGAEETMSPPVSGELAAIGKALVQKGALACVDCHAVGKQSALAGGDTVTINFARIPDRLRREYFDRYVLDPQRWLPGTMMPRFVNDDGKTGVTSHFGGDASRQFDAIWHYMRTVRED